MVDSAHGHHRAGRAVELGQGGRRPVTPIEHRDTRKLTKRFP